MADDDMDWVRTTPPLPFNPYSNPRYMPGGWPGSPPAFRCTAGVFARKRKPRLLWRATKRLCLRLVLIGSFAVVPPKAAYRIVIEYRERKRQQSHRLQRSKRANTAILRVNSDNCVPAPQVNSSSQPIIPQPSASEKIANPQDNVCGLQTTAIVSPHTSDATKIPNVNSKTDASSDSLRNSLEVVRTAATQSSTGKQTPLASSPTNTEPLLDWSHIQDDSIQDSPCVAAAKAGIKRRRSEELAPEEIYLALQHTGVQAQLFRPTSPWHLSERAMGVKRMRVNRFDSTQQKPASPATSDNSIGTRLQSPQKNANIYQPWYSVQPINITPPPSPSQQMQQELQQSAVKPKSKNPFETSQPLDSKSENIEGASLERLSTCTVEYDNRWISIRLPEEYYSDEVEPSEPKEPLTDAKPTESSSAPRSKLFHAHEPQNTPPPVRGRSVYSSSVLHSSLAEEISEVLAAQPPEDENLEQNSAPTSATVTDHVKIVTNEPAQALDTAKVVQTSATGQNSVSIPTTPAKKEHEIHVSQTPSQQLAGLSLQDNDTPKATPHSGTKNYRVTRYREAIEKAQKARLEEYELVPVSEEWIKKVRGAVRTGISRDLGPGDLARVVPQYAGQGQDNWLNDETINSYLALVAAHGKKNDRPNQVPSHHAFNNFFYNNLRDKGPSSISRWAKRAGVGGKNLAYVEKIFVPINSGMHWTLAVVEPTSKTIKHYNSLGGAGTGVQACQKLGEWVAFELGKDYKKEEWTSVFAGDSPQQTNSDDCGVFTITSARQIMLGYTPMSYNSKQIPAQRVRIVAELINGGLLRSSDQA